MPGSLNDDLVHQEKEITNQGKNPSDDNNANVKPSFHSSSMVKNSEFLNQAEHVECGVFTKGMASTDVRKLPAKEVTCVDNEIVSDMHCTKEMEHRKNVESKRNSHEDIVNSNIIKQMDIGNNPDTDTCHVENSRHIERNKNQNTIHTSSKDSTAFEYEEKISSLSCDAKVDLEWYRNLRSTACMDDFGIKKEFSNSEESNVESDTVEINTDSHELKFLFENPTIPKYFSNYVDGLGICGDSYFSIDLKPTWLDVDKFQRGQKVALKYFFGIEVSQMLSLMILFNFTGGLESLIFTGNSDTPFKAFKRYLSTALKIKSWYLDDLWNSETRGHKNLKTVRAMHEGLRKNLTATDPEERDKRCTLSRRCPAIWSTLHKKIRQDFEETCPYARISQHEFFNLCKTRVSVNQTEMGITQFGFVGLFITYPACFGAHSITDKELDSFVYLWKCIGYLLGIEDKYNFCNGDFKTVRQKANDLIEFIVKPNLQLVTQDWEHMSRCVVEGVSYFIPGITFEVSLLYLCNMFGLCTPRLWAALSFIQKITYYILRFTFWFILRLPGSMDYINRLVHKCLERAENASPSRLKRWNEKKYPYQENANALD